MCLQWFLVLGLSRMPLTMLGIALTFATLVWALRAATPAAAASGALICFLIGLGTASAQRSPLHSGLLPLAVLFVLTFAATRAGRARKVAAGLSEPRSGRATSQILANLGVAALVAGGFFSILIDRFGRGTPPIGDHLWSGPVLMLAALAEAAADTVSSETGQAFGGTPILLTTLRRVAPGTDGGITLLGTAAGLLAAAIVAFAGGIALDLGPRYTLIAFVAGSAGLFFDSVLGATLERRHFLGNDAVNFLSTLFAAVLSELFFLLS